MDDSPLRGEGAREPAHDEGRSVAGAVGGLQSIGTVKFTDLVNI